MTKKSIAGSGSIFVAKGRRHYTVKWRNNGHGFAKSGFLTLDEARDFLSARLDEVAEANARPLPSDFTPKVRRVKYVIRATTGFKARFVFTDKSSFGRTFDTEEHARAFLRSFHPEKKVKSKSVISPSVRFLARWLSCDLKWKNRTFVTRAEAEAYLNGIAESELARPRPIWRGSVQKHERPGLPTSYCVVLWFGNRARTQSFRKKRDAEVYLQAVREKYGVE